MPAIQNPLGVPVINLCCPSKPSSRCGNVNHKAFINKDFSRQNLYKWFILFLTFIVYMAYHMSRYFGTF